MQTIKLKFGIRAVVRDEDDALVPRIVELGIVLMAGNGGLDAAKLAKAVRPTVDNIDGKLILETGDPAAAACHNYVTLPYKPAAARMARDIAESVVSATVPDFQFELIAVEFETETTLERHDFMAEELMDELTGREQK